MRLTAGGAGGRPAPLVDPGEAAARPIRVKRVSSPECGGDGGTARLAVAVVVAAPSAVAVAVAGNPEARRTCDGGGGGGGGGSSSVRRDATFLTGQDSNNDGNGKVVIEFTPPGRRRRRRRRRRASPTAVPTERCAGLGPRHDHHVQPAREDEGQDTGVQVRVGQDELRFECKVDGGTFAPCSSPHETGELQRNADHTFSVRAIDAAGVADPSPASETFRVLKKKKRNRG